MSPMLNRVPRQGRTLADWLLMLAIVALPGIVAFAGLQWVVAP